MLDVAPPPPPPPPLKYKPRKVSAVRDFPPGCGRHAPPLNQTPTPAPVSDPPPSKEETSSNNLESVPKNEPAELSGLLEAPRLGNGELANGSAPVEAVGSNDIQPKEEKGEEAAEETNAVVVLQLPKEYPDPFVLLVEPPKAKGFVRMMPYSKNYPPPKRRKVTAVRDFPAGCGRNAPCIGGRGVAAGASPESKSLGGEKKPVDESSDGVASAGNVAVAALSNGAEQVLENGQDSSAGALLKSHPQSNLNADVMEHSSEKKVFGRSYSEKTEAEVTMNDDEQIMKKAEEISREGRVRPVMKSGSNENVAEVRSEKKVSSRSVSEREGQEISSEARAGTVMKSSSNENVAEVHSEKKVSVRSASEKKVQEISSEARVGTVMKSSSNENMAEVHSEKKVLVRSISEKKVPEISSEARVKPVMMSSSNENVAEVRSEKKVLVRSVSEKEVQGISSEARARPVMKSSSNENMAEVHREKKMLVPSVSGKKVQEISSEACARPVMKSSSNENVAEVHSEKKVLVRSVSEKKLGMHDLKQVSKNLQVVRVQESKPSRLDARPQSASKIVEKENRGAVGRSIDKGSVKRIKDSSNLKRKFAEESEVNDRAIVVRTQEDTSLEDYSDRLIVQALMSAQNCPWRLGKKSRAVGAFSATPKTRVKREGKQVNRVVSPMEASASHRKSRMVGEDEEDGAPRAEDNAKARDVYQRLCEVHVNLTPFGPSTVNQEDGDSDGRVTRNKVKKALRLFQVICRKLLQGEEDESKGFGRISRVDLTVAGILKENRQWVNTGKPVIGNVPGVEVGDEFHYRVELSIVGLHRPFQGGIDSTKLDDGMLVATSIVASGGYPDDMDSSDVLIYSGSGGNPIKGKQAGDQKLERGNLALKNCIAAMTPVRVIHGFKEILISDSRDSRAKYLSTFTYDGLYLVENYWPETGPRGFSVFKFQLRKIPGQPELGLKEVRKTKKSKVREGQCENDISEGKEKIPICAVNKINDERPAPFKYTTRIIYPSWFVQTPPVGCDCTGGCSDSAKCACAVKNGGEIPFNFNGAIVQAKPLVYECGPSCKCPPSCHNRVSQHGIKIKLEIFKTKSRGWGVRSLSSIPSGSFICEYIGELLKDTEAELRSNDEYLFDIGHNYDDHSLWEGLPSRIPGLQSSSLETTEDVGFTIDAAEYGNVGRFINHSCSPNLYAQNVLYDHDDKRMPHIMLFAADNIPPLQELTYHYNYTVDQVRDSEGNIKRKICHCGSPECTGRLY